MIVLALTDQEGGFDQAGALREAVLGCHAGQRPQHGVGEALDGLGVTAADGQREADERIHRRGVGPPPGGGSATRGPVASRSQGLEASPVTRPVA